MENMTWYQKVPNINKVDVEDLKFVFYQAEKMVDDTIKNFDSITSKSNSVVTIITTILIALVGYFFVNYSYKGTYDIGLSVVFLSICYFTYPTYLISKNIISMGYATIGSNPEKLISNQIFTDEKIKSKDTHRTILLSEIIDYKRRIEDNIKWNNNRTINLDKSVKSLLYYPFFAIIAYLFSLLLSLSLF